MKEPLEILFEDQDLVAISKPAGLLVHRTNLDKYENLNAQELLSEFLGYRVFPVHRIDKPTSGVVLFCKDQHKMKKLHEALADRQTRKKYTLICRGWTPELGVIDRPLSNPEKKNSALKSAETSYKRLAVAELDIPVSRYPNSRYSLVEAMPFTGRTHQIRMHFAQLRHYIIGDKKHGERHHNKMFNEIPGIHNMLLHARELRLRHPFEQNQTILIQSPYPEYWDRAADFLGWSNLLK